MLKNVRILKIRHRIYIEIQKFGKNNVKIFLCYQITYWKFIAVKAIKLFKKNYHSKKWMDFNVEQNILPKTIQKINRINNSYIESYCRGYCSIHKINLNLTHYSY